MVCATCIGKLDGIHTFASMALKSQEKLKKEYSKSLITNSFETVDSTDNCANNLEDRGLLHSILTKGSIDSLNDGDSLQSRQRTPSTEEMEVKVDPMLFLQCVFEQASSGTYSDYSDDSDKESNPYCTTISEPLSLTKKNFETHENKKQKFTNKENLSSKIRDNNDNEDLDNVKNEDNNFYNDFEEEEEDDEKYVESESKYKPYVCKVCAKPFSTQLKLQNHLWSHLPTTALSLSSDENKDYCQDSTTSRNNNNECLENNLIGLMNFICPICGKKISTKGNLKVHLETHRPKGKYGCDICGRIFKTQSNLFRHKEYHSNVQFPCSVCGRVYPTNSTLRAHSITHSDLRPHACPLCDKTFKRNQDLKFHINQHTGARPYQCPYCPKAFASSGNCFSHRKRMHPREVHRDRQRAADLMR